MYRPAIVRETISLNAILEPMLTSPMRHEITVVVAMDITGIVVFGSSCTTLCQIEHPSRSYPGRGFLLEIV